MGQTQNNPKRLKDKIFKVVDTILMFLTLLAIGLIAGFNFFFYYIDYGYNLWSILLVVLVLPIILLIDFIYLLIRWFRSKRMNIVFIIGVVIIIGFGFIRQAGMDFYFLTHQNKWNQFAEEIIEDQSIYDMSDCLRYSKRVNRYYHNADMEVEDGDYYSYFVDSLEQDGISEELFKKRLKSLRDLRFIGYKIEKNYIIFSYDGMVFEEFGFLYLMEGKPPVEGDNLDWGQLIHLVKLNDNWYYYYIS